MLKESVSMEVQGYKDVISFCFSWFMHKGMCNNANAFIKCLFFANICEQKWSCIKNKYHIEFISFKTY